MGYLISAHIVRDRPDVTRLSELPDSIGHRVYHQRTADVWMFDVFRASRQPDYPFQTLVPTADISLDLPPELSDLQSIYKHLGSIDLANAFKRSYVSLALLLNRIFGTPVLSFVSDDDELDFACTADNDALSRLKCRCGDLVITFQDGSTQIQPLVPEFDDDEEFLTNLEDLSAAVPGVSIAARDVPWDTQLHAIAIEEWRRFADTDELILGLGSFDPPSDESDWELVADA